MVLKIVSGGQTGVDRAALDVALENDIACGGWCPKGRMAEDGIIDTKYPLVETESPSVSQRTEFNVRDSDGTLILSWGPMSGGTLKTAAIATRLKRPLLVVNLTENRETLPVETWVEKHHIRVLNVAGPRASEVAQSYSEAKEFLLRLFVEAEAPSP